MSGSSSGVVPSRAPIVSAVRSSARHAVSDNGASVSARCGLTPRRVGPSQPPRAGTPPPWRVIGSDQPPARYPHRTDVPCGAGPCRRRRWSCRAAFPWTGRAWLVRAVLRSRRYRRCTRSRLVGPVDDAGESQHCGGRGREERDEVRVFVVVLGRGDVRCDAAVLRSGCRYSTWSACISQRLRPVASRFRTKSAEPKQAIREPRSIANRPAICASSWHGASC